MEEKRRKKPAKELKFGTPTQLILTSWETWGRPVIGAHELSGIQTALSERFGAGAVESPAAIARVLADQGAELRHPEVIELDAVWRAERIREEEQRAPEVERPLTLAQAESFIKELEKLRIQAGPGEAQRVRTMAIEAREAAQRDARRKTLGQAVQAAQHEIAEWLGVWIKTPGLFWDWLELRRRAADFKKKFPNNA